LRVLPLAFVLVVFFLLSGAMTGASGDGPDGCEAVFAATSRGGASAPSGRAGCTPGGDISEKVLVEKVIDGDTIRVTGGHRLRYIGLNAPEVGAQGEPFGVEATRFNRDLVEGKQVRWRRTCPTKTGSAGFSVTCMWMIYL
jgi:hypothetical protein